MNDKTTATERIMARPVDKGLRDHIFERRMEDFLKTYAPLDHYDRCNFERDLHMLVRSVYEDAQAPLLEHVKLLMNALAMSTTTFKI